MIDSYAYNQKEEIPLKKNLEQEAIDGVSSFPPVLTGGQDLLGICCRIFSQRPSVILISSKPTTGSKRHTHRSGKPVNTHSQNDEEKHMVQTYL